MSSVVSPAPSPLPARFQPQERAAPAPKNDIQVSPFPALTAGDAWTPGNGSAYRSPQPVPADDSSRSRVYLHACGRLEKVMLERLSLNELIVVARGAFDFRADQELILTDKVSEPLSGDAALRSLVDRGDTIYVRLSEGALHDFEQRIDQLQHMQIGFLCDQLSSIRQEQGELRTEIKHMRLVLDQEQSARELAGDVLRRAMEDVRTYCQRLDVRQDEKIGSFEATILDLKTGIRDEALAREHQEQELNRQLQEFRGALVAESRAREQGDERLRREVEEGKHGHQLEANDREDCEVRWERKLQEVQKSMAHVHDRTAEEVAELRRQNLEVKQAAGIEERERMGADADLSTALKELRASLTQEARERVAEATRMAAMRDSVETSLEAERIARQAEVTELTQQLSVAVEGIQEEQTLRSSEDAELSQMLEVVRRSVEEGRRKQAEADLQATRVSHDLAKRFDEEVHTRDVEVSKLMRLVSEETVVRQEALGKVSRSLTGWQEESSIESDRRDREYKEVVHRLEACQVSIKGEGKQRLAMADELSERILQQQRHFSDNLKQRNNDSSEVTNGVRELRDQLDRESSVRSDHLASITDRVSRVEAHRDQMNETVTKATKEQAVLEEDMMSTTKELRVLMERESQTREKGIMALSRQLAEMSKQAVVTDGRGQMDPAETEELTNKIRNDCLEVVHTDMGALREGLTKVVEAVQQERRSRAEGDNKLREDCREAIQKEINERVALDAKVTREIEAESRHRMEAVEVIELAIQECRHGLEIYDGDEDGIPANSDRAKAARRKQSPY